MAEIDRTHEPSLRSSVPSANGHPDFPIQNLPFGVFTPAGDGRARGGVAIGDMILDLAALCASGLVDGEAAHAAGAGAQDRLNALFALGAGPRRALRARLSELLAEGSRDRMAVDRLLRPAAACTLHLPARIGDYTDFYVGIHHATNVGGLFRPDNPLLPNYKHVPIGYHGRASSVVASGTPVRRPNGQRPGAAGPSFGPAERLDYELELGIWVGPGCALGETIAIDDAAAHIAGFCLLNDWSARDIQAWEYQPLGPFLAKSFATTVSPWVITPEALAPFRIAQPPRPEGDPNPLPYLLAEQDQRAGALDLDLEVRILSPAMKDRGHRPRRLSLSSTRHMYWTAAQMLAHHASNGCNLQPGDLLGSGTISAPDPDGLGSLLEATQGGRHPVLLPSGEERRFLEDGDEVLLTARARREGRATIGFGECRGTVLPAAVAGRPTSHHQGMRNSMKGSLLSRRAALSTALTALALPLRGAVAQGHYPDRPVKWIVAYAPGGGSDTLARLLGANIATRLGQPVVIDNRPGAATTIGAEATAKSAPDGYTVFTADNGTLVFNPALFRRLPYDPEADFRPIGLLARFPLVLVVKQASAFRTARDFIDGARARPGEINYGSAGVGSPHHLTMERLSKEAGIRLNHVPYRGVAPAVNDLLAGTFEAMVIDYASGAEYIRAGRVKALAACSGARLAAQPDLPTVQEALGLQGFESFAWQGLVVPARTPDAIAHRLTTEIAAALRDEAVAGRMRGMGLEPLSGGPEEFRRLMAAERAIWAPLIRERGITLD